MILFNLIYWFIHDVLSNQGVFWRLSNDIVVLDSVVPMFPLTSSPLLGLFHDSRRAETAWGQPCVQLRSCTGPLMFSIDGGWEDQAHTSRRLRGLKLNLRRSGWVRGAVPRATILLRIFRLCQTYKIHVNPMFFQEFLHEYSISGYTAFLGTPLSTAEK